MELLNRIKKSSSYIKEQINGEKIDIAIVLGTGLSDIVERIENKKIIKYKYIPEFPVSTVQGHASELIFGKLNGKNVLAMNGRFHYYEGYTMEDVTLPIRVFKALGIEKLIITNAAGGMNKDFERGDLMIIKDHINLIGDNPLIGKNYDEMGPRFPDMSEPYNKKFISIAKEVAEENNIDVKEGVYVALSGPTYETPAELKMLRNIGADSVGMSTVPEVIIANHMSMNVLGISCITDMAIAETLEPVSHELVQEAAKKAKEKFIKLVEETVGNI